jgi:hypothetical protein
VVVSPAAFTERYGDAVLLALTSRPQTDPPLGIEHWREAGLPKPTWIKPLIATLAASMFTKTIGRIDIGDWPCVQRTLRVVIAGHIVPYM